MSAAVSSCLVTDRIIAFESPNYSSQSHDDYLIFDRLNGKSYTGEARFLCEVSLRIPNYGIIGLLQACVVDYCVFISARTSVAKFGRRTVWQINKVEIIPVSKFNHLTGREKLMRTKLISSISEIFSTGLFYYSEDFVDLTNSFQRRSEQAWSASTPQLFFRSLDDRFVWNKKMVDPLTYIPDIHTFVVPVICGFVGSKSVKLHGDSILLNIVQIARICFTNAGTFTHATGLDQDGNAAFTVETETVIIADEYVASHVRASAPLQWKVSYPSTGFFAGDALIIDDVETLHSEQSIERLRSQLLSLTQIYGRGITIIDLCTRDGNQKDFLRAGLDNAYKKLGLLSGNSPTRVIRVSDPCATPARVLFDRLPAGVSSMFPSTIGYIERFVEPFLMRPPFDCAKQTQEMLQSCVQAEFSRQKYFSSRHQGQVPLVKQTGIYRVSDFECVEDSNTAQFLISRHTVTKIINELESFPLTEKDAECLDNALSTLWHGLGDALSHFYLGSDSLSSLQLNPPVLSPVSLSVPRIHLTRYYFRYFLDADRQDGIDIMNGTYIPEIASKTSINAHHWWNVYFTNRDFYYQASVIRYFKFLRFWLAPRALQTLFKFLVATGWLGAYVLVRKIAKSGNDEVMKISKRRLVEKFGLFPGGEERVPKVIGKEGLESPLMRRMNYRVRKSM
ncbi:MAG: hypothetical protein SGCHY_003242 [Lobulomycetales sp.]